MFQRTYNPGPSQVSDAVKADLVEASKRNIIGISHRSQSFLDITGHAVSGLRQYFNVPGNYHVVFTSSATEALELTIRNLVEQESFHFTNGHFSELFARVSESFGKTAQVDAAEWGHLNNIETANIPTSAEIVTLTYNETSTGVTCDNKCVHSLHNRLNNSIFVADITSAAGCIELNIADADVWLFSVQKGMGLPSGLGVMFISDKALGRSRALKHAGLFNFDRMVKQMQSHQTIQTPNVLGIYLLGQQLGRWNSADPQSNFQATAAKAKLIDDFVGAHKEIDYFVQDPAARSQTTICLEAKPEIITRLHKAAKGADLVIGAGYGKLKDHTCRIATFPALTESDIKLLLNTLEAAL